MTSQIMGDESVQEDPPSHVDGNGSDWNATQYQSPSSAVGAASPSLQWIADTFSRDSQEVMHHDVIFNYSANKVMITSQEVWPDVRGILGKIKDPQQVDFLKLAYKNKLLSLNKISATDRDPLFLVKLRDDVPGPFVWNRRTTKGWKKSFCRLAEYEEFIRHVNEPRSNGETNSSSAKRLRNADNDDYDYNYNLNAVALAAQPVNHIITTTVQNGLEHAEQGHENQHDADNGTEDDQQEQDRQDEPNDYKDAEANEVEIVDDATIGTFSVRSLSDALRGMPSRHKTTLSDETKRKLSNRNIVLTEADMKDLIYDECQNIHDLFAVYNSTHYKRCLQMIRKARGTMGRLQFAESWAKALSNGDHAAEELNSARRICLWLLYAMYNCAGVTEEEIVKVFGKQRILDILSECLAMDRASAWYNLTETGRENGRRGVHWYAESHEQWYVDNGHGRVHQHTMNKRLVWLFDIEGLHLRDIGYLNELIQPARTPLADEN